MKSSTGISLSIRIVAFVFIASGLLAWTNVALALADFVRPSFVRSESGLLLILAQAGALILCSGIVGVGIGLLRLSPKSWHFALVAVWIIMGIAACLVTLISLTPVPGYQWQGEPLEFIPIIPGVLSGLFIFAIFYWKYRVLVHAKTRRLFYPPDY
jgi:hypothetical protein